MERPWEARVMAVRGGWQVFCSTCYRSFSRQYRKRFDADEQVRKHNESAKHRAMVAVRREFEAEEARLTAAGGGGE